MTITYSAQILETYIAPGISSFTRADIPDMSAWDKESPHYVANFFLNSVFTATFAPPMNAYAYNFLRRVRYAFSEHHLARESTLRFLSAGGQSPRPYVDALFHWESFLGQAWHAFALLIAAWDGKAFDKGDGSVEQRLNALYNQMKHVQSRIESNQMIPGATVPVWLTNSGLQSVDTNVTYAETGDVLKALAKYASALMNPKTAKAAVQALDD